MGGAERVIANLANYFVGQDYKVYMFTEEFCENECVLDERVCRIDVGYQATGQRLRDIIERHRCIRQQFKNCCPDAVVSFIGKTNIRAILAGMGMKFPVIVSVRSAPAREYYSNGLKCMAKLLFGFCGGVIFQTEGARNYFSKRVQRNSIILPNPLLREFLKPRYEGERENEIVSVGRLDSVKNQVMLLDAFAEIASEFPETILRIYGEGKMYGELEKRIEEKGLQDKAFLMGNKNNIVRLIEKSRIFALTSNIEGMPNALMEAMALGLVVVSTDCPTGGPRTLIKNGKNGILVPVGDTTALAAAFRKILKNAELEMLLGREAHKIVDIYNPDKVYEQWKQYIESKM